MMTTNGERITVCCDCGYLFDDEMYLSMDADEAYRIKMVNCPPIWAVNDTSKNNDFIF